MGHEEILRICAMEHAVITGAIEDYCNDWLTKEEFIGCILGVNRIVCEMNKVIVDKLDVARNKGRS